MEAASIVLELDDLREQVVAPSTVGDAAQRDRLPATAHVPPPNGTRMYAITFDLDTETLQRRYPGDSWRQAYAEIRRVLLEEGFEWQQGSVYFGDPRRIDAVTCVLAAQRLSRDLGWFSAAVRDIRMLRIEENNDLGPAVAGSGGPG